MVDVPKKEAGERPNGHMISNSSLIYSKQIISQFVSTCQKVRVVDYDSPSVPHKNGVSVKLRLADNPSVVDLGLTELRSQMRTPPNVLGLAVKESSKLGKAALLQLCAGNHCLVVQLHLMASIPQSLITFLVDVNLTFVGAFMVTSISKLKNPYGLGVVNGIEVAELAAKILKNHSLIGISDSNLSVRPASLSTVASAIGLPFEYPKNVASVEPALPVFTQEEIDYLVRDVYELHLVGKKLLESL